jgi:hypothetical protein
MFLFNLLGISQGIKIANRQIGSIEGCHGNISPRRPRLEYYNECEPFERRHVSRVKRTIFTDITVKVESDSNFLTVYGFAKQIQLTRLSSAQPSQ